MNNSFGSFALPTGYDWDVKTFAKKVKTKKWVKDNLNHLGNWADRLTSANIDNRQVIGGMLQAAYGGNIGLQVEQLLTDDHLKVIRLNIIKIYYK